MTAKEKAIELVENFEQYADYTECDVFTQRERMRINAKKCALICVDEVIKALRKDLPEIGLGKGYWYTVKKEIELL